MKKTGQIRGNVREGSLRRQYLRLPDLEPCYRRSRTTEEEPKEFEEQRRQQKETERKEFRRDQAETEQKEVELWEGLCQAESVCVEFGGEEKTGGGGRECTAPPLGKKVFVPGPFAAIFGRVGILGGALAIEEASATVVVDVLGADLVAAPGLAGAGVETATDCL